MKNLIFIGMPAVGKSTVGVVVAKRLGMNFLDTDLVIQEKEGRLLSEIIEQEGEDGFLELENRINRELDVENTVISPGGSVIYGTDAMRHFKETGIIIYLHASYGEIKRRIRDPKKRGIVLRPGQSLRDLYKERVPYFESYADITVSEDGCRIEETITNVLREIAYYGKKRPGGRGGKAGKRSFRSARLFGGRKNGRAGQSETTQSEKNRSEKNQSIKTHGIKNARRSRGEQDPAEKRYEKKERRADKIRYKKAEKSRQKAAAGGKKYTRSRGVSGNSPVRTKKKNFTNA